jgi:antitoxin component YwqK of YwqJK toxin-antitoxin module
MRSLLFLATLVVTSSYAQKMSFVMDSIMDVYMKNGYANKHFMPKGKEDANSLRQGNWKDYEVEHDFMYVSINGVPKQIMGDYLLYGEGKFVDGKREGLWKMYVLEDKTFKRILQKEVNYVSGERTGIHKYFFPNGKVSHTGSYETDRITELTIYYDNGKLYTTRNIVSGLFTGKATRFHPNGKILTEFNYEKDTINGVYQSYYSNGNLEELSFFKMGIVDGIYKYYHENGQLWIEKEYKDGFLMNVRSSFDESGKPRDFGTLSNGNGTLKLYTREGKIYMIQTYQDGQVISEEKYTDFEKK